MSDTPATDAADRASQQQAQFIDVRLLPPRDRHPMIFGALDELAPGEALRILNDHDPSPLRYQLEATRPNEFEWIVVEAGPEDWMVDIVSNVRVVDARPVIASGGEPFDLIMAAAEQTGPGQVLVILAPFEPVPLEGVLGEQGFDFEATEVESGDWRVRFWRS